ncbi:MAG: putative ral secretion pathway protein GspG [Candidatus Saccharibacteria bacterium]|nr:putative ral secretion pathway protein GspG [Candidatus Saccharibacteria bacterium]MDB5181211.1 putative ral secretion pathway protein GspG [Candidatus Saccharibacteria bacterium]
MRTQQKQDKGFTIVELLIVVVVIAILAAITIVSYNGIQRRASNSIVLSSVSNWEKIIRLYQVTSDKLPDDWTCLGTTVNDFPDDSAYGLGVGMCERGMIVADGWTSEFKTVPPQPTKPTPTPVLLRQNASAGSGAMKTLTNGTKVMKGVVYAAVSSQTQVSHPGAYLFYALDSQACPSGEAHKVHGNVNVCARALTAPGTAWIDAIDV